MSDIRTTLHSAYTFIRSVESNKSHSSITLDHMVQEQISSLKRGEVRQISDARGESVGNRLSMWDRLEDLEKQITLVVQAVKDAGNDPDKLDALGIDEAGKTPVDDT